MKVTPLDLRQQRFNTVMRGYDRSEVNAFLAEAADDYENAIRENDRLRQEMSKLELVLKEHRSQEINLRNTLLTAQKLADDIKDNAQHEAARILREAEGRSDLLLHKSQSRLEDVQREIDGLRMKRREVETSLEGIIATINNTITFVREQDAAHREEKILLHRPRQLDPPPVPQPQAQAVNQTHPASAPHSTPATQAANPSLPNLLHPSHLAHLSQPTRE